MNFKDELNALANRMFDKELLDTLLEAYQQEAEHDGYGIEEKEYREGVEALSAALNEEQKTILNKMENLCQENIKFGVRFGFTSGVFAGFQQFFVEKTTDRPFEAFVHNRVLLEPNMKNYSDYYQRRCEINNMNTKLDNQLDADNKEHLVSVGSAWDSRLYGVLRHSFYLGYRYSISVIDCVKPLSTSLDMTSKILLTEYELGFISPLAEWEQRTNRRNKTTEEKTPPQGQSFAETEENIGE